MPQNWTEEVLEAIFLHRAAILHQEEALSEESVKVEYIVHQLEVNIEALEVF